MTVRIALLAMVALTGSGLVVPADTPSAPDPVSPAQQAEELEEVLVEGRRIRRQRTRPSWNEYQQPFNFLARLVGEFDIDGSVDLQGQGNPEHMRRAQGRAHCIGFGSAPGVQCQLNVRWPASSGADGEEIPGGVSTLDPAMLLLGFDPVTPGISHVLLDNRGVADNAVGRMNSPNTMLSRSRCVGMPGNCQRTVRITAEPDLDTVRLTIGFARDQQDFLSLAFVMRRVPGTGSVVYGGKQQKQEKK